MTVLYAPHVVECVVYMQLCLDLVHNAFKHHRPSSGASAFQCYIVVPTILPMLNRLHKPHLSVSRAAHFRYVN